ncbi:MAG: S1C family serine protease [Candidatus Cloacimonadaceae bacterium]|jgi:hypothetical protein
MKKTLMLILLLATMAFLAAQTQFTPINPISEDEEPAQINYDDEVMLIDREDAELEAEAGYLGIYVDDLNFPKAQALNYTKNFGVLVIGVVADTPAAAANLMVDDIIMMINEQMVNNKQQFIEIQQATQPGDVMKLKIWRAGAEQNVELILSQKTIDEDEEDDEECPRKITVSFKPNLSTGYGGGSWLPMWATVDLADINQLLERLDFDPMRDKGILMQGGGGKIHIGKGFFFGIQGISYEDKGKRNDPQTPADSTIAKIPDLTANYMLNTFEFTIDKRFAIKPWLVLSIGTGLGTADHKIELYHDESGGTWPGQNNYQYDLGYHKAVLKKNFLTVHPRFEALFPILSWFGMRLEAGYNYGFSPYKGWKQEEYNGDHHQIANSPETTFGAFTIGAGPWFGF